MPKKAKLTLVFAAVVVGGFFGIYFLGGASVPSEFLVARMQGALIAENIVKLSSATAEDLGRIKTLDQKRDYKTAIELTTSLLQKSRGIRDEATKLSAELEKMTRALSDINSFDARQAALEAISNHLALLSRLINYSVSLGQLMESLQARFAGTRSDMRPAQLVGDINAEVTAINSFNVQAVRAMERFDALTK